MRMPSILLLGAFVLLAAPASFLRPDAANAQVAVFEPSDYGKNDLRIRESLGRGAEEAFNNGNVFEPIGRLKEKDPIRATSRPIVRLDVLSRIGDREALSVCTASIVGKDTILTNYHCIPGLSGKVEKASILIDYLEKDSDAAVRLDVSPEPIVADEEMDYAFVRVLDPIPADVRPLHPPTRVVEPEDSLLIVHHPAGQVKVMTRFQCFAHDKPPSRPDVVRHICDTLGGSSGGILFDATLAPVALHHTGGLNKNDPASYNQATALAAIAARHPDLLPMTEDGAAAGASDEAASTPATPDRKPATGAGETGGSGLNDLIQ